MLLQKFFYYMIIYSKSDFFFLKGNCALKKNQVKE